MAILGRGGRLIQDVALFHLLGGNRLIVHLENVSVHSRRGLDNPCDGCAAAVIGGELIGELIEELACADNGRHAVQRRAAEDHHHSQQQRQVSAKHIFHRCLPPLRSRSYLAPAMPARPEHAMGMLPCGSAKNYLYLL